MIYEYREYHTVPGRMEDLKRRFRDAAVRLFEKHGLQVIGYWQEEVGDNSTLIYLMAFRDYADREAKWKAFRADPEWQAAFRASEANGQLTTRIVNRIWRPVTFTPAP